ncbi:unnamed protein product [Calypogeia fissa]
MNPGRSMEPGMNLKSRWDRVKWKQQRLLLCKYYDSTLGGGNSRNPCHPPGDPTPPYLITVLSVAEEAWGYRGFKSMAAPDALPRLRAQIVEAGESKQNLLLKWANCAERVINTGKEVPKLNPDERMQSISAIEAVRLACWSKIPHDVLPNHCVQFKLILIRDALAFLDLHLARRHWNSDMYHKEAKMAANLAWKEYKRINKKDILAREA